MQSVRNESPASQTAGNESLQWRPALQSLPQYVPGNPGRTGTFKLSSNEMPFPPSAGVIAALADAMHDVNRYPQMHSDGLAAQLATLHGVDAEQVVVGNGSVALIELILRSIATDGDEVVYSWRSFEAYPIAVAATGARSVQVPNTASGRHDLPAMVAAITPATKAVMVCTPNNPTSTALTHSELVEFCEQVPSSVLILLDEAYWHFDTSQDRVRAEELLATYKNVITLRTFSKAYGLAGLRVGYAIGRRRLMRQLQVAATPFGTNALGQIAALAALRDQATADANVAAIIAKREEFVRQLQTQGWQIPAPQGNFVWLALGDRTQEFAAAAQDAGVMVRPFAGEGVRITIGESEANAIALEIAAKFAPPQ